MTKKKRGSSSVYRTGTDSVKIRLMVLTVLAALLLLTALCAKYICPYDPYEQNLLLAKQPPGPEHLLGTDRYGRDMFSRILIAGTTIVESIFMWDGVGKMAVDAITMRDYPVVQAYVAWMAVIYVAVNLITDIVYHYLDPRVRLGGEQG